MAQANATRTVYVQPTTGGRIEIKLPSESSVTNLKMIVAKRLKVPKDKIVLLHKNKQLTEGSLDENNIVEGSKLILLPNVETGLMTQSPEQCVMQALESLTDSQVSCVDNFLAGRSPLNLTMRLGDHMMFIQLQLSTVSSPSTSNNTSVSSPPQAPPTPPTTPTSTSQAPPSPFSSLSTPVASSVTSLPSPPPSPQPVSPESTKLTFENPRSSLSNSVFKEASRNLTQTLRQLSSSALTKKMNESCDGRCCLARKQGGAVIESMYHHGRGVFSGTFSGTLNPLLQDKDGRPRRNVCTIIHILNDLLGASSHCNPSSQCLCSNTSPAQSKVQNTSPLDAKETSNQNEDKGLREKVHQLQTMLKEKRLNRSARRDVRTHPYSCSSRSTANESSQPASKKIDSNGVFLSSINTDCNKEQPKLMDFSSETAVA